MSKCIGLACNIKTGKLDANQAVKGGVYPFFTCAEYPDEIDRFAFDGDVVLVAGNNAQGNFHVSRFTGKFNAYQRTYVLSARDGFDIDYIYYALRLELKRLREKSQGSQTKFLTLPILTGIHLQDLSFDAQSSISGVLKVIDAKIDCNNRINAELEAMANALYEYWFVQFDFPDANGKPYKSSGGKLVYNDTLKREIPAGWSDCELGSLISFQRGISYKSSDIQETGVPFINLNSFTLAGAFKIEGTKFFNGKYKQDDLIDPGRLVIAITDVTRNADIIGKAFVLPDVFDGPALISCDVAAVHSVTFGKSYLERLFNSSTYHKYIKYFASGTLVLHLDLNGVNWFNTVLPHQCILEKYEAHCAGLLKQREIALKENQQLAQLRDWLLPLLMNGQVTMA